MDSKKEVAAANKRAKNVDLIILPEKIDGTRCGNCMWFDKGGKYCFHPKVRLPVTARMCCALWETKDTQRVQFKFPYQRGE